MIQIEIINSKNEDDLVYQVNYFLSKIDECLVKDIKYSSFSLPKNNELIYSCLIIYLVR